MNTYEIIKMLAKQKKISIRQLEMRFGYSNGYLAKWANNTPNSDELIKLADYFNVSVDYLLGRENRDENSSEYYFAIQRKSKKMSKNEQKKLLQLMELTFDDLDDEDEEDDDL